MLYLGDYATSSTVYFKWNTFDTDGASITRATDGTLRVYKNGSTTERSSANGITSTEDFGSTTGVHHVTIDLSDNTDAGFYAAGSEYAVVFAGMSIDGFTVNACIAHFSIERSGGVLAVLKSVVSSGGVNVTQISGDSTAADNAELFFDNTGFAASNSSIGTATTIGSTGLTAINAEVVDCLNTDTYAEPGQESPGTTLSLAKKIGYLYKAWRNLSTQTATQYKLYNSDQATVDQKATTSDDGTTFTRTTIVTGP